MIILLYVGLLLAVTLCCTLARLLRDDYKRREADRADMDARDAWANDYIKRQNRKEVA